MDSKPTNAVLIAFIGFAAIIAGGFMVLTYTGRDIGATAAYLIPFVGTIAGIVGLSAQNVKVKEKVDTVSKQVNGRLDAKLDALHEHLTNAGVPDPRPAPYTEPVGESATGIDTVDGPND